MSEPEADPETPEGLLAPGPNWVGRFEWERLIRQCRLGFFEGKTKDPRRWVSHASVQHVALMLATFADMDGTRIKPSVAMVARVCEMDERTVRTCIHRLRGLELLTQVRPARSPGRGGGEGKPAVYRMSVPADLLKRVAHLDGDGHGLRVIVPDGVDVRPQRKPRKPRGGASADEALWSPQDEAPPVENP